MTYSKDQLIQTFCRLSAILSEDSKDSVALLEALNKLPNLGFLVEANSQAIQSTKP